MCVHPCRIHCHCTGDAVGGADAAGAGADAGRAWSSPRSHHWEARECRRGTHHSVWELCQQRRQHRDCHLHHVVDCAGRWARHCRCCRHSVDYPNPAPMCRADLVHVPRSPPAPVGDAVRPGKQQRKKTERIRRMTMRLDASAGHPPVLPSPAVAPQ